MFNDNLNFLRLSVICWSRHPAHIDKLGPKSISIVAPHLVLNVLAENWGLDLADSESNPKLYV